jgi:hypothetical protein
VWEGVANWRWPWRVPWASPLRHLGGILLFPALSLARGPTCSSAIAGTSTMGGCRRRQRGRSGRKVWQSWTPTRPRRALPTHASSFELPSPRSCTLAFRVFTLAGGERGGVTGLEKQIDDARGRRLQVSKEWRWRRPRQLLGFGGSSCSDSMAPCHAVAMPPPHPFTPLTCTSVIGETLRLQHFPSRLLPTVEQDRRELLGGAEGNGFF